MQMIDIGKNDDNDDDDDVKCEVTNKGVNPQMNDTAIFNKRRKILLRN